MGVRENNLCPICGSSDRERWQKYVLMNFTDILKDRCNVLHIAPEKAIYRFIMNNTNCDYYAGDIELNKTQHRCDLTNLQFKDSFFDYIIANHVLEHIPSINIAFSEIKRVLKPDGKFIVSFPICTDKKTIEETSNLSDIERLKMFGQVDHVRLFGYDYKNYLEHYGFTLEIKSPQDILDQDIIEKYGFIKNDVSLICKKKRE